MKDIVRKIVKEGISCLDNEENRKEFYEINNMLDVLYAIRKDRRILRYANPDVQIKIINNVSSDSDLKRNFENASEEVKKNNNIARLAYMHNCITYNDLPDDLKSNINIIKIAIGKGEYTVNNIKDNNRIEIFKALYDKGKIGFNQLPNELKKENDILKKAFFRDEIEFEKISNEVKDNVDFLMKCVEKGKISFDSLSPKRRNDILKEEFLEDKIQYSELPDELKKDKDIIEKLYQTNLSIVEENIGESINNEEEYQEAKYVISKIDKDLLHDVDFVKKLLNYNLDLINVLKDGKIEKNDEIINFMIKNRDKDELEEEFINTKNYIDKYIGDNTLRKNLTIEQIRDNEELVKIALENGASLNFASNRLKLDKDFLIKNYLNKDYRNYNLIPTELYKDNDIMNIIYKDKAVDIGSEMPPNNIEYAKIESLNNYRNTFFVINSNELEKNEKESIDVLKTYMLSRDYRHFQGWDYEKYMYADKIFSDENFMKKVLEVNPNIIRDIPTEYFKEDYIELGCKGNRNLDVLPKNYFFSKENAIKLTQKIGWCLESFPKEFREDKELVKKLNDIENSRDNTMEFTTIISDGSKINDIDLYEKRKIEGDEFETDNLRNAGVGGIWGAKKDDIYGSEWIRYVIKNNAYGYEEKYDNANKVDYITKDTTRVISFDQFKDTIYKVYTYCENSNMSSKEKRETMLREIKERIGNDKIKDLILFYSEKSAKDESLSDIISLENNGELLQEIQEIQDEFKDKSLVVKFSSDRYADKIKKLQDVENNILRVYFAGTYADTREFGLDCPTLMLNKTSAVDIKSQEIVHNLKEKIEENFKDKVSDFYEKYIRKCDYEERIDRYNVDDLMKEKNNLEIKLEKSENLKEETKQYLNKKKIQKNGVDYIGK